MPAYTGLIRSGFASRDCDVASLFPFAESTASGLRAPPTYGTNSMAQRTVSRQSANQLNFALSQDREKLQACCTEGQN
jgi:hypothetical protein